MGLGSCGGGDYRCWCHEKQQKQQQNRSDPSSFRSAGGGFWVRIILSSLCWVRIIQIRPPSDLQIMPLTLQSFLNEE